MVGRIILGLCDSPVLRKHLAKAGGQTRAEKLSAQRRKEIAIKVSKAAVKARTHRAKGSTWLTTSGAPIAYWKMIFGPCCQNRGLVSVRKLRAQHQPRRGSLQVFMPEM
jgi:hypothetical protein